MSQSWIGDHLHVGPPESLSVLLVKVLLSCILVQCVLYFGSLSGVKEGRLPPLLTGDFYSEPVGTACLSVKLLWEVARELGIFVWPLSLAASSAELGTCPEQGTCCLWCLFQCPGPLTSGGRLLVVGFWDGAGAVPALGAWRLQEAREAQTVPSTVTPGRLRESLGS